MSDGNAEYRPVSGSCPRCSCALGFGASWHEGEWYCCGECALGGVCVCGCHPGRAKERPSDLYIPARRMFASRHPDYLNTPKGFVKKRRAFPFAERVRRKSSG